MPVVINDHTWYRKVRIISRNTLAGWPKEGMISAVEYQVCRDLRLFNQAQVEAIRTNTNHLFALVEAAKRVNI